jgi:hypothetical protein
MQDPKIPIWFYKDLNLGLEHSYNLGFKWAELSLQALKLSRRLVGLTYTFQPPGGFRILSIV